MAATIAPPVASSSRFTTPVGFTWVTVRALVHHGGESGRVCFNRWQEMRLEEAVRAIGEDI